MKVKGFHDPRFDSVAKEFSALWDDVEIGASLAIFVDGKAVINLWGGHKDARQTKDWGSDTLVNIYSATKGIIAMAVAHLVGKGMLCYNAPVSEYWPEFGAEQKFDITIDQLISHQAGLFNFSPTVTVEELYDWQKMTFNLAAQKPRWKPGTNFAYHAITWGYLIGEIIKRVTGQTIGTYLTENIATPLEADIYLGLKDEEIRRCADMIGPNRARKTMAPSKAPKESKKLSTDPVIAPYRHASSDAFRKAEIPSSNGHATALGLARCYDATISGSLIDSHALHLARTELTRGEVDRILGQVIRRARGFILNSDACYFGPSQEAYGHSGAGGAIAFADPENHVAFAYTMNQLHFDGPKRSKRLIDAFYQCI